MTVYRLILGLSADPVHSGHVEMVTQAVQALTRRRYDLMGACLVPVYRRNPVGPEKSELPGSFEHRLWMCRLAAREMTRRLGAEPGFVRVSAMEAGLARGRTRPNFTVETLRLLKLRTAPRTGLIFLVSSELVSGPQPELVRWYRPDRLLRLAHLAVCPRPGYPVDGPFLRAAAHRTGRIILLPEVETPDVSSTELRILLEAGLSPIVAAHQGLLPLSVARYLSAYPVYG